MTGSTSAEPSPTSAPGMLSLDVFRGCCYTEGSFFFVRVRDDAANTVQSRRYGPAELKFVTRLSLAPGTYSLVTYERPCEGACPAPSHAGALDPPTGRCKRNVTIMPGERQRIRIVSIPGHTCGGY